MEREYLVTHAPELETLRNQYSELMGIESRLHAGVFDTEKDKTDMLYRRIVLKRNMDSTLDNPATSERAEEVATYSVLQVEQAAKDLERIPERSGSLREKTEDRKALFQERLGTIALIHSVAEGRLKISKSVMERVFAVVGNPEDDKSKEDEQSIPLSVKLNPSNVILNGVVHRYAPERNKLSRARILQRRRAVELLLSDAESGKQYTSRELWDGLYQTDEYRQSDMLALRQWLRRLQVDDEDLIISNGQSGKSSKLMVNPLFKVSLVNELQSDDEQQAALEEEQAKEVIKLTDNIADYMPELYTLAAQMWHYTELFEYFNKPTVDAKTIDRLESAIEEMKFKSEEELAEYRKYSFAKLEALFKDDEAYTNLIDNTSLNHPGVDMLVVLAPHLRNQRDRTFLQEALNSTRTSREVYRQGRTVKVLEFVGEHGQAIYSLQQESNA